MTELEEIYSLYFEDVYKYVLSLCRNQDIAEDITQETFLKALKGINDFKGDCKLRVWLCQIAKNTYFSLYEKNKKLIEISESSNLDSLESRLIEKETALEVHKVGRGLLFTVQK